MQTYTPKEANEKHCCSSSARSFCTADNCMAWQWALKQQGGMRVRFYIKSRTHGYCGLVKQ